MKKLLYSLLTLSLAFSFQSCLHDQEDVFDMPAAQRLDKTIKADKELLESATNGWKMTYFVGEDYSGGGYTIFVKFKDGKAYASGDISDEISTETVSSSSYDVIGDQGPVLTFNTFNEVIHEKAQPYMTNVEGEQGDYEFVIMSTSQDTIKLKGKKWGNSMTMVRVADDVDWSDYLAAVKKVENGLLSSYKSEVDGATVKMSLDLGIRQALFSFVDGSYEYVPYLVTPSGISLAYPVDVAEGKTLQEFIYDAENITMKDAENGLIFNLVLPDYYMAYEDFAGNYTLKYNKKDTTVQLVPAGDGKTYVMKGISEYAYPVLEYDKAEGVLTMTTQIVGKNGDNYLAMCGWGLSEGGFFYFGDGIGMCLKWDYTKEGTVLKFESLVPGYLVDSFIFAEFSGYPFTSSNYIGVTSLPIFNKSYGLPYLKTMTKIEN